MRAGVFERAAQRLFIGAAARERRCLIICSGFYEWTVTPDKARLPWYITRADAAPMAFAGVWQGWDGPDDADTSATTCAIVTTAANTTMSQIHKRMPVILAPEDWPLWLGEAGKGAARIMKSAPEDALSFHRVSTEVNSNRATGAGLLKEAS